MSRTRPSVRKRLSEALRPLDTYCIRPTERGFALWSFKDWPTGWFIRSSHTTREQAGQALLEHLGLEPKPEPPKLITATISYVEPFDTDGPWSWG